MNKEHQEVTRKLISITRMSLLFMAVELIGGYLANSIAIFADAFHLLSDVLAYSISLGAVWLSTTDNPPKYLTFGWEKAQPLGALINIAVIYVVTAELFVEATKRMINQEIVDKPFYMLITSIFGLGCNLIIMRILHSDPHGGHNCGHDHGHGDGHQHNHDHNHAHSHGHGHSHQHTHQAIQENTNSCRNFAHEAHDENGKCTHDHDHDHNHGKSKTSLSQKNSGDEIIEKKDIVPQNSKPSMEEGVMSNSLGSDEEIRNSMEPKRAKMNNINLEAAYIHVITDIILSIGVIISALIIYFMSDQPEWTPWQLADPFCTYLFSVLAIYSTWPILKEAVLLLLDASHDKELVEEVENELKSMEEVQELIKLKLWSTNRDKHYAAVRVRMLKGCGIWRVRRVLALRGIDSFVELQEEELSLGGE